MKMHVVIDASLGPALKLIQEMADVIHEQFDLIPDYVPSGGSCAGGPRQSHDGSSG
jgi:hypothetical protein